MEMKYTGPLFDERDLNRMPTISKGHFSDLKFDDGNHRVWLSRMNQADDGRIGSRVEYESLIDGRWLRMST